MSKHRYAVIFREGDKFERVVVTADSESDARQAAVAKMYRKRGKAGTQGFQVRNVIRMSGHQGTRE